MYLIIEQNCYLTCMVGHLVLQLTYKSGTIHLSNEDKEVELLFFASYVPPDLLSATKIDCSSQLAASKKIRVNRV